MYLSPTENWTNGQMVARRTQYTKSRKSSILCLFVAVFHRSCFERSSHCFLLCQLFICSAVCLIRTICTTYRVAICVLVYFFASSEVITCYIFSVISSLSFSIISREYAVYSKSKHTYTHFVNVKDRKRMRKRKPAIVLIKMPCARSTWLTNAKKEDGKKESEINRGTKRKSFVLRSGQQASKLATINHLKSHSIVQNQIIFYTYTFGISCNCAHCFCYLCYINFDVVVARFICKHIANFVQWKYIFPYEFRSKFYMNQLNLCLNKLLKQTEPIV